MAHSLTRNIIYRTALTHFGSKSSEGSFYSTGPKNPTSVSGSQWAKVAKPIHHNESHVCCSQSGSKCISRFLSLSFPRSGTWAVSSLNENTIVHTQPCFEIDKIILDANSLSESVRKRQMALKKDIIKIEEYYNRAKEMKIQQQNMIQNRDENARKIHQLLGTDPKGISKEVQELRAEGKKIREDLRRIISEYNVVNDDLVDFLLSLPNVIGKDTPTKDFKLIKKCEPLEGGPKWVYPKNVTWGVLPGVKDSPEYTIGDTYWLEMDLASKAQNFLIEHGFQETGQVRAIRKEFSDGSGLEPDEFLRIREQNFKSGIIHANYLVGNCPIPPFLALLPQSCVKGPKGLPLKFFVFGRGLVRKGEGVPTKMYQAAGIQVFVATKNHAEMEREFERLGSLMETFFTSTLGLSLEMNMYPASKLKPYEQKKIGFSLEDSGKIVGTLSSVGDFVSKRLISCYSEEKGSEEERKVKFLHMVTGHFFKISQFLRPSPKEVQN